MTTFFFLFSLTVAWSGWNLFNPIFSHKHLATLSFFAGWLVGELALHVIFWQILGVGVFVLIGAVTGFFGAAGFLLCAAGWAAMGRYYYLSTFAKQEVESALAGLDIELERELAKQQPSKTLLRNPFRTTFKQPDPAIETIQNVQFGDFGQKLDIRRARIRSDGIKQPVLLQIHGGAWTQNYGSKNEQAIPLMHHMARLGWVCVAASYRLSPAATFPEHIIDCKQALIWIKDHIAEYGGDPDFIAVTGGSAGGHLSSLLALSANHAAFQPGFEDRDTKVQAAVPFYGVYDFTDSARHNRNDGLLDILEDSVMKRSLADNEVAFRDASPLSHISESAPDMLIIHGTADSLVPVAGARAFADELKRTSSQKSFYLELAGAQHAFDMFPSVRSEYVKFGVEKFLTASHQNYLNSH